MCGLGSLRHINQSGLPVLIVTEIINNLIHTYGIKIHLTWTIRPSSKS